MKMDVNEVPSSLEIVSESLQAEGDVFAWSCWGFLEGARLPVMLNSLCCPLCALCVLRG